MNDQDRSIGAHLQLLEKQLLQPETRNNPDAAAALLTEDFREFGSSGRIYTKPEIIVALAAELPHAITLQDFDTKLLSDEIALVTYRSRSETGDALRSSLWVLRDGRWRMLFHQGTKVPGPSMENAVS